MKRPILLVTMLMGFLFSSKGLGIELSPEFLVTIEEKYGEYAKRRLAGWQALLSAHHNKTDREKVELVNQFFNRLPYKSDIANWGVKDYWATPLEFLVAGAGDCEDYSIAKYFSLIKLGVSDKKLLITYVKAKTFNQQAHMVLTYYETPESIPLVLDNIIGEVKTADQRNDLTPIYSFNASGLWLAKQQGLGKRLGQSQDVKMWRELEKRMEEGHIGEFTGVH